MNEDRQHRAAPRGRAARGEHRNDGDPAPKDPDREGHPRDVGPHDERHDHPDEDGDGAPGGDRNPRLTPMPPGVDLDGPEPGDRLARLVWRAARTVHIANDRLRAARGEFAKRKSEYLERIAERDRQAVQSAAQSLHDAGLTPGIMIEVSRLIAAGRREEAARLLVEGLPGESRR